MPRNEETIFSPIPYAELVGTHQNDWMFYDAMKAFIKTANDVSRLFRYWSWSLVESCGCCERLYPRGGVGLNGHFDRGICCVDCCQHFECQSGNPEYHHFEHTDYRCAHCLEDGVSVCNSHCRVHSICDRCYGIYRRDTNEVCEECRFCQNCCVYIITHARGSSRAYLCRRGIAQVNAEREAQGLRPIEHYTELEYVRVSSQPFHVVKTLNHLRANRSRRLVAAEIEVCGLNGSDRASVSQACKLWGANIVRDGSLPSTGFEINTAPAAGDLWLKQISDICTALVNQEAWVDGSAGCHVHTDARDFTFYDIRRLIMVYNKIEPALFSMVEPARRTSHYCKPSAARYIKEIENRIPKLSKQNVLNSMYGKVQRSELERRKRNRYDDARYYALNIHSFFIRGTVECRLMQGIVDYETVSAWGMLWEGILDFAYKAKEKDLSAQPPQDVKDSVGWLLRCAYNKETKELVERRVAEYNPTYAKVI